MKPAIGHDPLTVRHPVRIAGAAGDVQAGRSRHLPRLSCQGGADEDGSCGDDPTAPTRDAWRAWLGPDWAQLVCELEQDRRGQSRLLFWL
jgi:hypothetical protein